MLAKASTNLPRNFDAQTSSPRLVMLVSPTCPVCLSGVEMTLGGLDTAAGQHVETHVVWVPILGADNAETAAQSAIAIGTRARLMQYFDDDVAVSTGAHTALDFAARRRRVAWDLYLFYRAGPQWTLPCPMPDLWLHQLDIPDQPNLDASTLTEALRIIAESPQL